ncbi:MAG TPA: RdgB/HAM1 family non-canonical purine NTP pyrophosphatase [Terriglobales bacterium]|nr:RdgB/HAM1 family non-canonical purine NTP pyrophosphatase [Terriglobales bacterium]
MATVLIATSNGGKLRDFAAAAAEHGMGVEGLPHFSSLPTVSEDQPTFEANARKKAEHYSRFAPGTIVLGDDSGLEVAALKGAPGVHSARYAAKSGEENASDAANNARLLKEMRGVPEGQRAAQFVCVIVVARDGQALASFRGEAKGTILHAPRGSGGFGYDPLFYFPVLRKTFAELSAAEKAGVSHRGQAFRKFLAWWEKNCGQGFRTKRE